MNLGDVIDLETLQQIQDCFAKATGFAAIMVDYQGNPLLEYSGFSNFCGKLREDPYYDERCRQSDAHGSLEAVRRNSTCIYRCHAGLVDFAIPIIVEGQYVASMMCGQVLAEDPTDVRANFMQPTDDIFIKSPELSALLDKIPAVPFKRIQETANLMYLTLNYIVEQYLLNQKNLKLLRDQKEKIELEKQYKDLEIRFYNSQINPHFLFNALNAASRQAYLENAEKTQEIIYALADMYRYSLGSSGLLISIEQELFNLKNYIFIQEIRFGGQLKITLDIPESIYHYVIPAMSLQILVENAVIHGLEPKENLGSIHITGKEHKNRLLFTIADDGVGMPADRMERLNDRNYARDSLPQHAGTGIYNIYKRLEYFFPGDYSIKFQSNRGRGIKVLFSLPAAQWPLSGLENGDESIL